MSALRLQTRILLGSVATALLAVFLVWASISAAVERFVEHPDFDVPAPLIEQCKLEPATYAALPFGRGTMRLYNADGQHLNGPALSAEMVALKVGEASRYHPNGTRQVVRRLADSGDCALVAYEFGGRNDMDLAFRGGVFFGIFAAMLAAMALTYRFTVVPLLQRIERLRIAGVHVGADAYDSASDTVGDDLTVVSEVLDRSHARISADREELVRRHEALERYLAEIAHDLRTPLGSMILALQDVDATASSDSGRAVARRALSDATYVATLVENLHQAARLRSGLEADVGQVDLTELLQRIETRFRALGEAAGVSVNASLPEQGVTVSCEPSLVERAVSNLVHNSTRHGASNVAILLDVDGSDFTLTVLDDGPGVPPETLPSLADRTFATNPARPRNTGLGLAITNEVVRRLGWTIDYAVPDDGGLSVTIAGSTNA